MIAVLSSYPILESGTKCCNYLAAKTKRIIRAGMLHALPG